MIEQKAKIETALEMSDEISLKEFILKLRDLLNYLISQWKIILVAGIMGGMGGLIYSYYKKPLYTAELTFVLEEEQSTGGGLGGYASLAGQFGMDLGGGGGGVFSGDNLIVLMKSRNIIEKALLAPVSINGKRETLAEVYIRINKKRENWIEKGSKFSNVKFLPDADPSKFSLDQNTLITAFYNSIIANNLTIEKLDKKSSIVAVRVISQDELFAKKFSEAVTEEVSDFYIETKTKKSAENLAILQYQTDSVKRAFNSAIIGVASSTDANPNLNVARQIIRVPSQRKQVEVQINQAILSQLIQNLEMAKVSLRKETPLIQIIDKPILPLKVDRVNIFKMVTLGIFIMVFSVGISLILFKAINSYLKT
ncbi:Wzz/FepE/Etk N-terminal domain-containing protein [Daejeonella sp. H1SJ63]|uniref:Wzz/FepE/Etk N-terminal domain-containing protein n=1 Tax=Daejeonella sp. H1SJ63 TaxID=3034145 RepID=UPI0023EBDB64|nr:Wzz/FepE/Etk N-terminal domain-containing protein [Daejeonella sp. H1SJ63]